MEFLIIAFKSKEESVKLSRILSRYNVDSVLTSPPKEAGLSCGISVKTAVSNFYAVKSAINLYDFKTFVGVFKVDTFAGRNVVKTIY